MKKIVVMSAAWAVAACAWAQTAALYVGSDWDEAGAALRAAWAEPAVAAQAGGAALAVVDAPEVVDDAAKAQWERQKAIRLEPRAYPAVAYFDKAGNCVLLREAVRDPRALPGLVAIGRARAEAVAGAIRSGDAETIGRTLLPIAEELGAKQSQNRCKGLWEALRKADPKDATGWAWALTFDPASDACYKVQDFAKRKDWAGGEAYIKELEAKPQAHLSANQRQGLMLLRYVLYRNDPAKAGEMTALLRQVLALGAETHFGLAAQGLLCLRGEGPVAVPYGWWPKDAKPGRQTWPVAVGVAKVVRAPGRYVLTLHREKGAGAMDFAGLTVGGRRYGKPAALAVGKSLTVPFDVRPGDKPELSLEVAFDKPGAEERGALWLRRVLPERPAAEGDADWAPTGPSGDFLRAAVPPASVAAIARRKGGADFLKAFAADEAWREDFCGSGDPLAGWGAALEALDAICHHYPRALDSAVTRRWAAAAALNAGEDPTDAVLLFGALLDIRAAGGLARGADALRCDQMRFTLVPAQSDAANARWLAARHNVPPRQYNGVCWAAPYRLNNFFGDSIHGRDYYKPWDHAYLRHEASRKVGGVCGALSYYGSAAAKAHGVPSTPGGQPGHCAYTVWSPSQGRWTLAYNIAPYTGPHFALWGGRGRYAYQELAAAAFAHPGMRDSMRHLWQAAARRAAATPEVRRTPMVCDAYEWGGKALPEDPAALTRIGSWHGLAKTDPNQAGRKDRVLLVWTGWLEAEADTEAEIVVRSDDGARLWVDGKPVAGKDGLHGMGDVSAARIRLAKGRHPFELRYFNHTGANGIDLAVTPIERFDPAIAAAYRAAAEACPLNYTAWRDWGDWLRKVGADAAAWRVFGDACAKGLGGHVEPVWDVLLGWPAPELRKAGAAPLREALVAWSGVVRQGDFPTAEFGDYAGQLNRLATLLGGDEAGVFACYAAALKTQFGTPDAFGRLMRWGGARFLREPDYAKRFVAAVDGLLQTGDGAGDALGKYVKEAVRGASEAGNAEAFHALCDLQDALAPRDRQPLPAKLPGELLSERGLLRLSSTSSWDHPEAYRAVIDGKSPIGNFHTGNEKAPWAEVVLPGMAEVSGVWLMNRGDQNNGRLPPFTVEVSEDGKAWHAVADSEKTQGEYTFTFAPAKATRVRVVCHPKDKTYLHLRKFCVFGKPLY